MIDPTKSVSLIQSVTAGQKPPARTQEESSSPKAERKEPADEVKISKQALSLQEAERAAAAAREALASDDTQTLGLDSSSFDEKA